ncbi:MAG: ABC-2 family transporter protein [Planctomycetes bacterium]|nr:ABC-2 family transporter protein [Planctomycetota bacterium]
MTPRLFWHVCGVEARKRMSYRVDFWLSSIGGFLAQLGVAYFIVLALFHGSGRPTIGGFTFQGMILYYAAVILLGRVVRGTEADQTIAQDIYEGGLTRYLLYPTSYTVFKYAQNVGTLVPALLQLFLLGAWFPLALGTPEGARITGASIAMGVGASVLASVLYFLLVWPIQAIAFWADNVWSLMLAHRILANLMGGLLVPLTLFPEWAQRALALLPFPLLFAFPVDALLGRLDLHQWLKGIALGLLWCTALIVIGRAVWRRGDRRYAGVGI